MSYTNNGCEESTTIEQLMYYIINNLIHFTNGEYAGYIPPSLDELYVLRGYVEAAIVEATTEKTLIINKLTRIHHDHQSN